MSELFNYPFREPPKSEKERSFLDRLDTELAKSASDYMAQNPSCYWEPIVWEGNRSYWREKDDYNCFCAQSFVCHNCKIRLDIFYQRGIDCPDLHYLCQDCSKIIQVWRIE